LALALPASTAEKLVARWTLGALGYPVAALAVTLVLQQISYLIQADIVDPWLRSGRGFQVSWNGSAVDVAHTAWTLFPGEILRPLLVYLSLQPIFLWGGLRFPSAAFFKTFILLGCGAVLCLLSAWLLYNGVVIWSDSPTRSAEEIARAVAVLYERLIGILRVALWALLPPLFTVFGYRRLRDAQG
jgi:hypothetical protein